MRQSTIDLYFQYEKLLYSRAWSWHRTTNIPVEELISEAKVAFFDALEAFNDKMSSLSSWLFKIINNKLANFCRRYHEISPLAEEPQLEELIPVMEIDDSLDRWTDIHSNLSTEAIEVVGMVGAAYGEGVVLMKSELSQLLRKKGWKWHMIHSVYKELKGVCK